MTLALNGTRFKLAEYVRQAWHVTPRPEDSPECLTDPTWWVHVARSVKIGDKIEALAEDRSWYAEGIVVEASAQGAKVALTLGPVKLVNETALAVPDDFEIKWAGPHAKFRVTRKKDSVVVKEQCQSQEEAASWLKNHRKALAA